MRNTGLTIEFLVPARRGRFARRNCVHPPVLAERGGAPGLVHIFSAMEPCAAFMPWYDKGSGQTQGLAVQGNGEVPALLLLFPRPRVRAVLPARAHLGAPSGSSFTATAIAGWPGNSQRPGSRGRAVGDNTFRTHRRSRPGTGTGGLLPGRATWSTACSMPRPQPCTVRCWAHFNQSPTTGASCRWSTPPT